MLSFVGKNTLISFLSKVVTWNDLPSMYEPQHLQNVPTFFHIAGGRTDERERRDWVSLFVGNVNAAQAF